MDQLQPLVQLIPQVVAADLVVDVLDLEDLVVEVVTVVPLVQETLLQQLPLKVIMEELHLVFSIMVLVEEVQVL
tara:strand:- start:275 stop:496 length:222 start_codon:yes stop_codon:yes gene_type:complete